MTYIDQNFSWWVLLHQTRDGLLNARARELGQYGITIRESEVLLAIQASGSKATPCEISRRLNRSKHSIYGLLNRMEKKGLIRKTKDIGSKNITGVSLTEKGEQTNECSTRRESIWRVMSALSEEERKQLGSYLRILRDRMLEEGGTD